MSRSISAHFGRLERHLIESDVVSSYTVVRRQVTSTDGKVRIRVRAEGRRIARIVRVRCPQCE